MEATTVAAQGIAEDVFNHATFNVSLSGLSDTPVAAKQLLAGAIEQLNATVENMKTKLGLEFVKNSVTKNSNVSPHYEWDDDKRVQEFKGHQVSFGMSFSIDDLESVNGVYDTLTSLETVGDNVRVTVGAVIFSITSRTRDRLNKKALKKAFKNVQDRFDAECQVLGLVSSDFEIATWEISYSDSRRSDRVSNRMVAMAAGAAPMAKTMAMSEGAVWYRFWWCRSSS